MISNGHHYDHNNLGWTEVDEASILSPVHQQVISDDAKDVALRLIAIGGSRQMAARLIGISNSALRDLMKRDHSFALSVRESEATAYQTWLRKMRDADDWRAAAWMLKMKHPDEFSEVKKVAQTDSKGRDVDPETRKRLVESVIRRKLGPRADLLIPVSANGNGNHDNGSTNGKTKS